MPPYLRLGSLPRKRHTAHRHEPGFRDEGIHYEEVITSGGFREAYSILYHLRPPTRVRKVEPAGTVPLELVAEPSLRHHHLRSANLPPAGDPVTGRVPLLVNDDVTIGRCRPARPQGELYNNATADEVIFVHRGQGELHTMFGPLPFRACDYLVIPRCVAYRLEFDRGTEPDLLVVEAAGRVRIPAKYLNLDGQIRLGAPYGERDLHGPREPLAIDREEDTTVLVKDGRRLTRYTLAHHPFDVVGWDGMIYPYTFNADDFEPITGTVHQPPPVQQTFDAPGFVICTFAPRLLDTHPGGDQGAVRPFERAGRRGALLRPRALRQPARDRGRVDHAAPPRHPARPAPRHHRRQPGDDPHGRTRGHGGHRAAPGIDPPGPGTRRPRVPVQLDGMTRGPRP